MEGELDSASRGETGVKLETNETAVSGNEWTPREMVLLEEVVQRAPSVHNTKPWLLQFSGRSVALRLDPASSLEYQDPEGRDLRISCGAAVANLTVAFRGLGWAPEVRWAVDAEDGSYVAVVEAPHRRPPTVLDRERWRAVSERRSYRKAFSERPIPQLAKTAILAASVIPATWVEGGEERSKLANILVQAAEANQEDHHYQAELQGHITGALSLEGMPEAVLPRDGISALGMARPVTQVPADDELAACLETEEVLIFSTLDDSRRDQLQAGEAVERVWLEATRLGLVGSVTTQPLRLPEFRYGLRQALGIRGIPQLLMRLGYPASSSPRTLAQWLDSGP
jgi:nitroreductase